jgi:sarcosine oxidase/L-pipecolate oxidase
MVPVSTQAELFAQVHHVAQVIAHSLMRVLDYVDEPYEILADRAQDIIKHDAELQPHYYENGFTFVVNGEKGELSTLWENMVKNIKSKHHESKWAELDTPDEVFQNLHGKNSQLVPESTLQHKRQWVKGYTSKRCATVNAEAMVKVYYDRARSRPNVKFVLGTAVDRLLYGSNNDVLGVILEDGREFHAPKTILAVGAWSSRLVQVNGILHANAVPIVYIRLTDGEMAKYKNMGCHTQLNLGVNVFTPIGGLLKVLRRSSGIRNTIELKDPEDASKMYKASYPITKVDVPNLSIPAAAEKDIREALREIFPSVADRPFERTKICW